MPNGPLATTSFNDILEFNYAFDEDETRGLLAGVQYTRADIESPLARINSNILGYVGGYYLRGRRATVWILITEQQRDPRCGPRIAA